MTAAASLPRAARVELIARADRDELNELADALLSELGPPTIVTRPEVGLVMMAVREPVAKDRFHLGEVVVTRAEVDWHGATGWAMRMGSDHEAALAAALCDAAAEVDQSANRRVDELCHRTAQRESEDAKAEWTRLRTTVVHFEELD